MRKKIINLLKQSARKPLGRKEFLNRLKLKQHEVGAAKILIREMIKSGDIISVKGKRLTRPKNPKPLKENYQLRKRALDLLSQKMNLKIFLLDADPCLMLFMVIVSV